jgi:hypothetical protein
MRKKTWKFDGRMFQIREITGEAVKNVESLNTTHFQVRSYLKRAYGRAVFSRARLSEWLDLLRFESPLH